MSNELRTGRPVLMLTPKEMRLWKRLNMEAFDRLPASIREVLRETGVEADHMKLEQALKLGVPELMVIDEIMLRVQSANRKPI